MTVYVHTEYILLNVAGLLMKISIGDSDLALWKRVAHQFVDEKFSDM